MIRLSLQAKSKQRKVLYSMYQSILHFIEKDIIEIEKVLGNILTGEKDADDLSAEVVKRLNNLACRLISEMYEKLDDSIRESIERKKHWRIERRNEPKEILDVAGMLRFNRTGYEDKRTGKYIYLLDMILGIESHQRLTMGAAAKVLEEAVQSSYAKGGRAASPTESASKQTVKELVHGTVLAFPEPERQEKKKLKNLHIVADEDHVSAQFWKHKGDLEKNKSGSKTNTIISKVIVLYEDVINESGENSKTPRYKLTGKRIFSGVHKGEAENARLWEKVNDYICKNYDMEFLERIYISGDGASWIKAGAGILYKSRFVLDKFHIMKYVNSSVTHLLDSEQDVKSEIWECINSADKRGLVKIYEKILEVTEDGNKYEEVKKALSYFMNQWAGIKIRAEEPKNIWKCCAEGQVSHVLSSRMSSRPMGWSEWGCHQMSVFRAFNLNGGNIIDFLRYQKKREAIEDYRKEQEDLINDLRRKQPEWKYAEQMRMAVPGTERHEMKWLRGIINKAFSA